MQAKQSIVKFLSRAINPTRIFIALMSIVIIWILPIALHKEESISSVAAKPKWGGACG